MLTKGLVSCTQHCKHHVIWLRIGEDIAQSLLKPHLLHQLLLSKYLLVRCANYPVNRIKVEKTMCFGAFSESHDLMT